MGKGFMLGKEGKKKMVWAVVIVTLEKVSKFLF